MLAFALFCILLTALIVFANGERKTFVPKDGYVPDAETAIRIAEAVWIPIYGAKSIEGQKPFRVQLLEGKIWLVQGTLKTATNSVEDVVGGVALAEIAKKDGRIIRVTHGK